MRAGDDSVTGLRAERTRMDSRRVPSGTIGQGERVFVARIAVACLAAWLLALGVLSSSGWLARGQNMLDDAHIPFMLRQPEAPVTLVAIDPTSLRRISVWPWPRQTHAALVDRLNELGARSINFDIDFSSPSNPVDDDILADALRRSEAHVSLAAHVQVDPDTGELIERTPIGPLREHATMAGVVVRPGPNGLIRHAERYRSFSDETVPSMASLLAHGATGLVRQAGADQTFEIDATVDPLRFAKVSYADLLEGEVDRALIADRDIIVGATAIELGDIVNVPGHQLIPGPLVLAMAAETLARDRAYVRPAWVLPVGLAAVFAFGWASAARVATRRTSMGTVQWQLLGLGILLYASAILFRMWFAVMLPSAPLVLALVATLVVIVALKLTLQRRESRAARARIAWQATYDHGCGALQRHALAQCLDGTLCAEGRTAVGLIAFELRRFGMVSGTLGTERAEAMLRKLVDEVSTLDRVREIGRVGEAEFVVWAEASGELDIFAEVLAAVLRAALPTERLTLALGTLPLAGFEGDADAAIAAVRLTRARAVETGRNVVSYDGEHAAVMQRRLRQELDLPGALARNELDIAYQPQIDMRTGHVRGVEALLRWIHPEMGFMRPDEFVAVAEAGGLIGSVGQWVLERACRDIVPLSAHGAPLCVSVNVSPQQFVQTDVSGVVRRALRETGMSPSRLELEITESLAVEDPDVLRASLEPLRARGVTVALDDFGTGYANLSTLGAMPLDKLKMDRSLILDLPAERATSMVAAALTIARGHGLTTVVEGVEDERSAELLRLAGCDAGQGYLWSRPLPLAELTTFIESWNASEAVPAKAEAAAG